MSIKIVTDSTAYIPSDLLKEYDISVVSLNVILNGVSRRELDLINETFYPEMDAADEIPLSSQPIPSETFDVFERIVKNGDTVFGIFISSLMSGTYSSTHLVKDMIIEKYPNASIYLMDSKTNSMQMGYIVIEAAKAALEGKSINEVQCIANSVLENSRFLFTPDTLDYLKKGGRIGGAAALLGSILQIKPILTVQNGEANIFMKVRTKKKAIESIINSFLKDIEGKTLGAVIVHHINCYEEGKKIADKLKSILERNVEIQSIGPVVGLHVGPGSIGIAYFTK